MKSMDLRKKREQLGLTQVQLAEALGISERTTIRYETGVIEVPKVVDLALETLTVRLRGKK